MYEKSDRSMYYDHSLIGLVGVCQPRSTAFPTFSCSHLQTVLHFIHCSLYSG